MVGQDRPDLAIERDGRRGIARRRLARDRQQYERGPDHGLFPATSFTMGPASQYKAGAGRAEPLAVGSRPIAGPARVPGSSASGIASDAPDWILPDEAGPDRSGEVNR